MLKLFRTVPLIAALTFIIWTENNRISSEENETRKALCSDVYNIRRQFPADESVRRKWIAFVRTKREPNDWTPGSGHICSDHFSVNNYEGKKSGKIVGF